MDKPSHNNSIQGSSSLREVIHRKRKGGQMDQALMLAKIGRRIVLQADKSFSADEASRRAFELYLELVPNDKDVQEALFNLPAPLISTARNYPKYVGLMGAAFIFVGAIIWATLRFNINEKNNSSPALVQQQSIVTSSIATAFATSSASAATSSVVTQVAEISKAPIVIRAVGDVVLGSNYPRDRLPNERNKKRMAELHQTLNNADVVVGNLEGVLFDQGTVQKDVSKSGYYAFRMPENYASTLREMGFDVLSLANNHSMDFGVEGLNATKKALLSEGIQPVGVTGAGIAQIEVRNSNIAFLSYSYLSNFTPMNNEAQIKLDIENAKAVAAIVVVTVHAGGEGEAAGGTPEKDEFYLHEYRGNVRRFAEFAIDSGASAVFGHGPHVVRPYEIYKNKPIFFSLGNFVGYGSLSHAGKLGSSIVAEVRFSPDGTLVGAGIIPLKMDEWGIPIADYSLTTLSTLDDLLDKQLEKRPVLELNVEHTVNAISEIQKNNVNSVLPIKVDRGL